MPITPNIPSIHEDLPTADKRLELFRLDAEPIMKFVTPGFGLFISRFTDDMLVSFFKNKQIDKYQKSVPSHLRYFYLIRAVWNQLLTAKCRCSWEHAASKDPHYANLSENNPNAFDRALKREIDRKIYEQSEAFLEWKNREKIYKKYFTNTYSIDLDLPADSPFEKTLNLCINIDYSESVTSPHSIQLLKVFLSLEQFVSILIESDKEKAVELLKQAVNYNPQRPEYLIPFLQKLLPISSPEEIEIIASMMRDSSPKQNETTEKLNYQQLAFYPLQILEKLLCRFSPDRVGLNRAAALRHQALKLGVMDFVLECLSHFTHQLPKFGRIRSSLMPMPQYSVRFSNENPFKKPISSADSMEVNSTTQPENSKFAKGTGYGSGDVKQLWDYKNSRQKIQYDDDNIACLLNILRAFIQPPIGEENRTEATVSSVQTRSSAKKTPAVAAPKVQTIADETEKQNNIQMKEEFIKLLYRSSLGSVIRTYMMSNALLEVSRNVQTYTAVFQLLIALSNAHSVRMDMEHFFGDQEREASIKNNVEIDDSADGELNCSREKRAAEIDRKKLVSPFEVVFCMEEPGNLKSEREKIVLLLKRFSTNIDEYLKRVNPNLVSQLLNFTKNRVEQKVDDERQLAELSILGKNVISVFEKQGAIDSNCPTTNVIRVFETADLGPDDSQMPSSSGCHTLSGGTLTDSEKYSKSLENLQFATISFEKIPHHFLKKGSKSTDGTSGAANSRMKRIAREIYSLRSGLTIYPSSSVFVRSSEENLDALKVLITGPSDTPYSNGCFEFDFYFPSTFPQSPPQVNLQTTGGGSVRFNPNLYNCGKVCLSILGTWAGRPEEQWNSETSTLLQVIISIQSLILVKDPYFNEPGYERTINTTQGDLASRRYNAGIQTATLKHAMIDMLKYPAKGFEEVIQRHFWLKRGEIVSQIHGWIEQWKAYKNEDSRVSVTIDDLEKYLKTLQTELEKLKKLKLDS